MNDHRPLAAIEAEQAILGALFLSPKAYERLGTLKAEHFYQAIHREIFRHIAAILEAGQHADVVTVYERLKAEAPEFADLQYLDGISTAFSSANVERHAAIVIERATRRGLVDVAMTLAAAASEDLATPAGDLLDQAQSHLQQLIETKTDDEPVAAADDMVDFVDDLDRRSRGEGVQGISTGFPALDEKLGGGLRPESLIIVAARPKMGKSAFAFELARTVARTHTTLILSMEMGRREIHQRNVAALGRVNLGNITNAKRMQPADWQGVTRATKEIADLKLFIHQQGGMRLSDVRAKARATKRKHGLDLLVVDYLQLMDGEGDTRNAQIELITRGLKSLAMDMGITIVLLSQLNRNLEARPNKRPIPSDLRDSGAIEQDCDAALFLYRDEIYNDNSMDRGICEVNVGLIRNGETGPVPLSFIANQSRFENLAPGYEFGRNSAQKPIFSGMQD